ncbi:MAG: DNA helicase PcrA [Lachnospiraceae bacterium]|nr:DNA helicase PcrA [Lachnospiraceae bacterium]
MSIYDTLNDKQKEAVFYKDGPLLILAGAGSGKTRVLTHRIAYLIEEGVNPWNILAITFTNKAAKEMRERVNHLVEYGAESIWVSTFHSMCVRILKRYIDKIGFDNNFTIYDTDDQKTVMKEICKRINVDTKKIKERAILGEISRAKNEMISPEEYEKENASDFGKKKYIEAYREYQKQLKKNNALDFDDLLVKTVELLRTNPDVLVYYQERFKYIMVDEYQDTNTVQFLLIRLLSGNNGNICVVGDDDQSIYGFRGANVTNILDFEKHFRDTKVIKLEQNYRSTQRILDAANAVISNNSRRKEKSLWTENDEGRKVEFKRLESDWEEAEYISNQITSYVKENNCDYNSIACLYRTNAQSRILEEKFVRDGIPYKIIGGQNFYQRKEIKDLIAYLKAVDNGKDDVAVKRIINVPKRGIGAATIDKIDTFAQANNLSFFDTLLNENAMAILGRSASKVQPFVDFIQKLRAQIKYESISDIMEKILNETGYIDELKAEGTDEAKSRLENIDEFFNKIVDFEVKNEKPTLSDFLDEISLIADIDNLNQDCDYVVLMTIHSAKGLEFPKVFLCGMEEGLFPGKAVLYSNSDQELEEERRLCYVAITRAMESITITCAMRRMSKGEMQYNAMSRFVKEIPGSIMDSNVYTEQSYGKSAGGDSRSASASGKFSKPTNNSNAKAILKTRAYDTKQYSVKKQEALEYAVGDTVKHTKFGLGKVVNITEGGRDYEVTVDFMTAGTKKMFASFAKLKKV